MERTDLLHFVPDMKPDPEHYFQSLINCAVACGLLSEQDTVKIQTGLFSLLAELSDRWNHGESSSIPTEQAKEILESIAFVIGVRLKTFAAPEQAAKALRQETVRTLFEQGLRLIKCKTAVARRLQKRIADRLFVTPNVYYRSTVIDGISGFFRLYRPMFSAHEIHITADYPACMGRPELSGIEFIEQYLRFLEAENSFLLRFVPGDVHYLLCGLTPDYRSIPMNLFEPVLLSALGLILAGRSPEKLDLSEQDVALLQERFASRSSEEIRSDLQKALEELAFRMELPGRIISYASLCLSRLSVTVRNAASYKTLDKVFLVPAFPEQMTDPYC